MPRSNHARYDSLNRLLSAQTTATSDQTNPAWGQAFVYDGFGNLYQKNVTKGSAPSLSVGVNQATNQLSESGLGYDANGNALGPYPASQTYDVENRVSSAGQYNVPQVVYAYDSRNRRVWKATVNSSGVITEQEMYFYGANGKKLGTYLPIFNSPVSGYPSGWNAIDLQVHFGKRRVAHWASANGNTIVQLSTTVLDRLGSVRNAGSNGTSSSFYPYGEDKGTAAPNDQTKFATYTRDSATGLDYARHRYYSSTLGRFSSADPYKASSVRTKPQSWNRYAYALGDPVNLSDPRGLDACPVDDNGDINCGSGDDSGGGGCEQWVWSEYPGDDGSGYWDCTIDSSSGSGINAQTGYSSEFYSAAGLREAKNVAQILTADVDLMSESCEGFLQNLSAVVGADITPAMIEAMAANVGNYIYDGSTSPTLWTQVGAPTPPGFSSSGLTVGAYFQYSGDDGLSQNGGYAVWLNTGGFANMSPTAQFGTIIHEILHKFKDDAGNFISDPEIGDALFGSNYGGGSQFASTIGRQCSR